MALPGSDDFIRGLTVDGWIVADEAAQLSNDLIAALSPMRARRPQARFAMLSTAWSRTDPFWTVWADDDPSWMRLKATAETVTFFTEEYLEQQRRVLGENSFDREYLGIPLGARQVHSAGTCMSARRTSISPWCSRVRPFNRPLRHQRCRSPTHSSVFKQAEQFDELQSR